MRSKVIIPSQVQRSMRITRAMREFSGTTLPERALATNNEAIREVKRCNYYRIRLDSSCNRNIVHEEGAKLYVRYYSTVQQYK